MSLSAEGKLTIALVLSIGFLFGFTSLAPSSSPGSKEGYQDARDVVKFIRGKDNNYFGSGVVIAPNKVLTAKHVALMSEKLVIVHNGKEYPGHVSKSSEITDVAIIHVNGMPCPCVEIYPFIPPQDTDIIAIGFPLNLKIQVLTKGQVQGVYGEDQNLMIISSPATYGNSGGGTFILDPNNTWKLAGILVGSGTSPQGPVNHITFVVHGKTLAKFLYGT